MIAAVAQKLAACEVEKEDTPSSSTMDLPVREALTEEENDANAAVLLLLKRQEKTEALR
jgi:hypothetical protein